MEPTQPLPIALPLAALHAAEPVTIDLTNRTWQGIPGLERTAKGRMFASWFTGGPKEPSPDNTVLLSYSDDGARTFTRPEAIGLPLSDGTRCYDPCLWIDPKGRLWYLFNRSLKDSTQHGVYARVCDHPDATPPVFGAEFRVGFDGPFSFRLNKPIALSTGEWIMPVTHALEPVAAWAGFDPKQVQGVGISTDEGNTWILHGDVRTPGEALENMIVELRDGRLWMLIRTGSFLWESHSPDAGRTWTEGKATTIARPHSRFFIRRLASGNLLLVNHHKFTGRSHLTAQLSTDDGATWNDGLILDERGGPNFPNGVPGGVSYPDGVQDKNGLIWITYDRNRNGTGEILLAKFREEDVLAGKNVSGAVTLKQTINKLDRPKLLPANWDPKAAADKALASLIKVTAPEVKGAHDAEFVCVDDRAYIVEHDNDVQPGHGAGRHMYCALSVVNLKTLAVETTIPMAKSEQAFENVTLPPGACFVPRIIQKDAATLRCFFASEDGDRREAQMWYRDFDLGAQSFAIRIEKVKLQTSSGVHDMQPGHFHADAAAHGFAKPAQRYGMYLFDSFKQFDGRTYVALNNFPGKQNALALVHDDLLTFEVLGHHNEPQSQALSESAVNRLPDGTWLAICRNDGGNYHFTTSPDGRAWTVGEERPFVPNGLNSKPTFDKFGGVYYLGWQEATRVYDADRSVFNVDISLDGENWTRKYRFESGESFQYPTFHEHEGAVWVAVTQGHRGSTDRIMFGKLEDLPTALPEANASRIPTFAGPTPDTLREVTIPTVDISADEHRQVVVARGTAEAYHGHCDTVLMADGKTMFATWCMNHAGHLGPLARSEDGGLTWSAPLRVPADWQGVKGTTPVIHRLTDPHGVERLFVFGGCDFPGNLRRAFSEDGGKTWSPMAEIGLVGEVAPKSILPFDGAKRLIMWSDRRDPKHPNDPHPRCVAERVGRWRSDVGPGPGHSGRTRTMGAAERDAFARWKAARHAPAREHTEVSFALRDQPR